MAELGVELGKQLASAWDASSHGLALEADQVQAALADAHSVSLRHRLDCVGPQPGRQLGRCTCTSFLAEPGTWSAQIASIWWPRDTTRFSDSTSASSSVRSWGAVTGTRRHRVRLQRSKDLLRHRSILLRSAPARRYTGAIPAAWRLHQPAGPPRSRWAPPIERNRDEDR